ncbi:hypothetical protein CEXT_634371 [Caerostris extrusa]|uniref:LAGLIDADG homing endonuclease n=1 Tax=Caerostris extrusa TaxID=172846 RepID=A0AAV4QN97_CAEEX|nr:hypothetical protein CEXT_634371 [Caerostris extrusa]
MTKKVEQSLLQCGSIAFNTDGKSFEEEELFLRRRSVLQFSAACKITFSCSNKSGRERFLSVILTRDSRDFIFLSSFLRRKNMAEYTSDKYIYLLCMSNT